ncbi:MAG TPA: AtpZ/AtpI family protein [Candidatus Wunengus sp. YC60]|uniref:AtpZ/AtpI family protein n=1 Tax=Candidatus Wunengus sp. YC60 TaxID=3367697 RepID=UPI00402731CD
MPFNKNKDEVYRIVGMVGSFGFTTAGAMAGGYFLGSYLDRKLNTAPWLTLSFIMLGVIGSFIEFFKLIKKLSGENKNKQ